MILTKTKSIIKYIPALAVLAFPFFAGAAGGAVEGGLHLNGLRESFGNNPANVLGGSTTPETLILNIINILLLFAAAIAVLFIIIGGYQYITSAGNEEQAEKGRKTLVNALIGVVVISLAYVIVRVIVNLVGR